MTRPKEIRRLCWYARGMGLKVSFKKAGRSDPEAEWIEDGSQITIYYRSGTSYRYLALSLIHELGHHKDFINKGRKEDLLYSKAFDKTENYNNTRNKKYRKRILDSEIAGTKYWFDIYRDTNCTFPIKHLNRAMDMDIWVYHRFYLTGYFPSRSERQQYSKELYSKYGC